MGGDGRGGERRGGGGRGRERGRGKEKGGGEGGRGVSPPKHKNQTPPMIKEFILFKFVTSVGRSLLYGIGESSRKLAYVQAQRVY
jgi:hypothetical protein